MSTKVSVVNLHGHVTVSAVPEFQELLRARIDTTALVVASLSQAEEIDLAGVQLLYSARRYAAAQGKRFELTGSVPEAIAERLFHGGFVSSIVRDGKELNRQLHEFDLPTGVAPEDRDDD
ncbi:MAG: STAS domain-containing protein [Spirochaeta sp.]|jgi:anti-anti-sigma regulatory factor|nr:STAS domain-containing protein [Spirochaeta sp.]